MGRILKDHTIIPDKISTPTRFFAACLVTLLFLDALFLAAAMRLNAHTWLTSLLIVFTLVFTCIYMTTIVVLYIAFRPRLADDEFFLRYVRLQKETRKDTRLQANVEFREALGIGYARIEQEITSLRTAIEGAPPGGAVRIGEATMSDVRRQYDMILEEVSSAIRGSLQDIVLLNTRIFVEARGRRLSPATREALLRRLQQATENMKQVIETVRFQCSDANLPALERSPVSLLADVLEPTAGTLRDVSRSRAQSIEIRSCSDAGVIDGDSSALRTAFYNIWEVLLWYSEKGRPLCVSLESLGSQYEIRLEAKLSRSRKEKLADTFSSIVRNGSLLTDYRVMGRMGLGAAWTIINLHKGHINVQKSTDMLIIEVVLPNKGSTVPGEEVGSHLE